MNKISLSKSKYCQCVQCEKIFWLNKYKPEEEAAEAFLTLKYETPEEQGLIREGLLRYCELDSLAMVKIWENFREVTI